MNYRFKARTWACLFESHSMLAGICIGDSADADPVPFRITMADLRPLEAAGLIERDEPIDPDDEAIFFITDAGREAVYGWEARMAEMSGMPSLTEGYDPYDEE